MIVRVEIRVTHTRDVRGAEVERHVLVELVGRTTRNPNTVGVRNHSHTIGVVNRTLVVSDTTTHRPLVVQAVVGTEREEPGVVPVILYLARSC